MQYYILYTYEPINLEQTKLLSALGLITPYDSFNTDINNYTYLPETEINNTVLLDKVKSIIGGFSILQKTELKEIQKNLSRIETVNEITEGDLVNYAPYKSLPLVVTNIHNGKAQIYHKLKNTSISLEVELLELKRHTNSNTEILYSADPTPNTISENSVYLIDCDVFDMESIPRVLRLMIQIKTIYIDSELIICNPSHITASLAKTFKIKTLYGSILTFIHNCKQPLRIVTDNSLYNMFHTKHLINDYKNNCIQFTELPKAHILASAIKRYNKTQFTEKYLQYLLENEPDTPELKKLLTNLDNIVSNTLKQNYTIQDYEDYNINIESVSEYIKQNKEWDLCYHTHTIAKLLNRGDN